MSVNICSYGLRENSGILQDAKIQFFKLYKIIRHPFQKIFLYIPLWIYSRNVKKSLRIIFTVQN